MTLFATKSVEQSYSKSLLGLELRVRWLVFSTRAYWVQVFLCSSQVRHDPSVWQQFQRVTWTLNDFDAIEAFWSWNGTSLLKWLGNSHPPFFMTKILHLYCSFAPPVHRFHGLILTLCCRSTIGWIYCRVNFITRSPEASWCQHVALATWIRADVTPVRLLLLTKTEHGQRPLFEPSVIKL